MFDSAIRFKPDILEAIQKLLQTRPDLAHLVGDIHTFDLVVDSQHVFGDLLGRYRSYGEQTLCEALVQAGVVRLHIPLYGVSEVASNALDRFSKGQAPVSRLRDECSQYRGALIVHNEFDVPVTDHPVIKDPKDVPYFQTMEKVGAVGILTKDNDFNGIGLRKLDRSALAPARKYGEIMERLLKTRIAYTGAGALTLAGIGSGAKAAYSGFQSLPIGFKIGIGAVGAVALAHPKSRTWLREQCKKTNTLVSPLLELAYAEINKDQHGVNAAEAARKSFEEELIAERDEEGENNTLPKRDWSRIHTVSLDDVLDEKTRRDLFVIPAWEEPPSAFQ